MSIKREELLAQGCVEVKAKTSNRKAYTFNGEVIAIECMRCVSVKYAPNFSKDKKGLYGKESKCKECRLEYWVGRTERNKEYEKERYKVEVNRKRHAYFREYHRKHYLRYPEKKIIIETRRRARKLALPDDLTLEEISQINTYFDNSCALSGETISLHLDHVIPIKIGHGGTTLKNMIPLSRSLNSSKGASHIFEWFDANHENLNLENRKFDKLIEYLAKINEMTPKEYRAYVDWCFDNPCESTTSKVSE